MLALKAMRSMPGYLYKISVCAHADVYIMYCRQVHLQYLQWFREVHSIENLVEVYMDENDQRFVELTHPTGSSATIHFNGATVSSWTTPEGAELLHLKQQQPGAAIRQVDNSCLNRTEFVP